MMTGTLEFKLCAWSDLFPVTFDPKWPAMALGSVSDIKGLKNSVLPHWDDIIMFDIVSALIIWFMVLEWSTFMWHLSVVILLSNTDHQRSKFWLSAHLGQPKKSPDNQKYWCSCPTDNHKPVANTRLCTCLPSMDNKKPGRTTRYCNLVVRGTFIFP